MFENSSNKQWLAPIGSLTWALDSQSGQVLALGLRELKIAGFQSADFKDRLIKLDISRNGLVSSVAGVMKSDELFEVSEGSFSKYQDLLTSLRKSQHLSLCRDQDVEASDRFTGFSELEFVPEALPDLAWDDISLERDFLGRRFSSPLLITGMTGGISQGQEINRRLARAAQHFNIPMGVGSQRIAIENPDYRSIFAIKDFAPDVFLIGNLGGSQLRGSDAIQLCRDAVAMIDADALAIHLNVLQECIQVEGSPNFNKVCLRLAEICAELKVPVIVKEVGSGISPQTAQRLFEAGVAAVDCGGRGGTSWAYIEGLRSHREDLLTLSQSFRDWGIPTAYSLAAIRKVFPTQTLLATGGIRDGQTLAKAVALGADMVGVGLPPMRAAMLGDEAVYEVIASLIKGLHVTMVATGSPRLDDLKKHLVLGRPLASEFRTYVSSLGGEQT